MEPTRRATLDDVAKAAGVALSTASRALRNHSMIARETTLRIQKIAETLGYRPNPLVRSLMSQVRTGRVSDQGACLAYLDMSPSRDFWETYTVTRRFLAGARERALALGYHFERFFPNVDGLSRLRLTRMLDTRGIRGVLLPVHVEHEPKRLTLADIPLDFTHFAAVTIGGEYTDPAVHFAANNQYMSARIARTHIDALGYKRPGLVIEPKVNLSTDSRFQAGFFSLKWPKPSMPVPLLLAKPGDELAFATWYSKFKPDCVIANFPYVHTWMQKMGLNVPRDCSFACLDWDDSMTQFGGLNQRSSDVSAAAVDLLVAQLDRNETGFPPIAHGLFIEGVWVDGPSMPRLNKT